MTRQTIDELDKLIAIAKTYKNNTLSKYIVYDTIPSGVDIEKVLEYISSKDIIITSDYDNIDNEDEESVTYDASNFNPFDSSKIDVSFKPITLTDIIMRLELGEIELMPDFQRKAGLWTLKQKSQLIESLILKIPLPAFYFDGSNNDKWVVIDGLQRLTTIKDFFIHKTFKLEGLEFLLDLNGTKLDDLTRSYIRRMRETQLIAYIINPGAPINVKYNIFKRINTGGLRLESQEIRNALHQGASTKYLKELAELEIFRLSVCYSVSSERMLDREFVLRFIAFHELGVEKFTITDSFLNMAMEHINKQKGEWFEEIQNKFKLTLELNIKLFGKYAFRRMPDQERRRPINKSLFEAWTTILLEYTEHHEKLITKKEKLKVKYMKLCNDNAFISAVKSIRPSIIFKRIRTIIEEVINNDK